MVMNDERLEKLKQDWRDQWMEKNPPKIFWNIGKQEE